jgi:hypothetical protein
MRKWDKEHPEYHEKWRRDNSSYCMIKARICTVTHREAWREILHGLDLDRCFKCGYDKCFYAIDYHHSNPLEKTSTASVIFALMPTEERINQFKKDVENGDVLPLCANCHREEHFRLGWIGRKKRTSKK